MSDEALAVADALPYPWGPFSHCYARTMRAAVEVMGGDVDAGRQHGLATGEVADRHGFTFWTIVAGYHEAATAFRLGEEEAGQRMLMMIGMLRSLGVLVWLPSFYATVSELRLKRGELDEADAVLRDAFAVQEETGARFWEAELTRQQGEVLLGRGDPGGVDRIRQAVAIAVEQGATLHELWARTSLCERGGDADHSALATLIDTLDPTLPDVTAARAALAARS